MTSSNAYGLSSCLTFRHVPDPSFQWENGWVPRRAGDVPSARLPVASAQDVLQYLQDGPLRAVDPRRTGLLLSSGMDSAILSALLPEGLHAFTLSFDSPGSLDEAPPAAAYAARNGQHHHRVLVRWTDYLEHIPHLLAAKRSVLHAVEVPLHLAAREARALGLQSLIVGNGADSTFGGLDQLLSRDYRLEAFIRRYTFVEAARVLRAPEPVDAVFAAYDRPGGFDVGGFLKEIHGQGITAAFQNALESAGVAMVEPYEGLVLQGPLDLARIRAGEPKYILRDLHRRLYPDLPLPDKVPFSRPMDQWLAGWDHPESPCFRRDFSYRGLTGDQKWIVYCLDRFVDLAALDPS